MPSLTEISDSFIADISGGFPPSPHTAAIFRTDLVWDSDDGGTSTASSPGVVEGSLAKRHWNSCGTSRPAKRRFIETSRSDPKQLTSRPRRLLNRCKIFRSSHSSAVGESGPGFFPRLTIPPTIVDSEIVSTDSIMMEPLSFNGNVGTDHDSNAGPINIDVDNDDATMAESTANTSNATINDSSIGRQPMLPSVSIHIEDREGIILDYPGDANGANPSRSSSTFSATASGTGLNSLKIAITIQYGAPYTPTS
ncbi:hypothetical protein NLJ89_g6690 [Agrocybe chaxingu]|uniref:Uncharacterized protein n=1 Tax=Agrocybe chaxingu TaxID=84603 RepID=A0A9W8JXT8_9AGAR|nr:hypothetical protein NLJ89_g6690 [Agrocybe chaxingu]